MSNSTKQWLLPSLVIAAGLTAVAVIGLVALRNARKPAGVEPTAADANSVNYSNQDVDPGTSAGGTPAPNFQLIDQLGRKTTLAEFRGKVVLIAFVDPQCTDICPLTTESMVQALRLLGPAAADVQLLGVNASPLALKVSDVAAYTRAHEMQGKWRFLTGSLPQLKKVWRHYHVYVAAINGDADHQPAMVLIGTTGREHKVYMTQMSYEGVGPQAQVLANDIAKLLPGTAAPAQEVSLKYVPPLEPSATVELRAIGNRAQIIAVGGEHAHLMLFFASWLGQNSNVIDRIAQLDRYAATARRNGWPSPVAVDELTTEASGAGAQNMLALASPKTQTPIVEDTNGRLGDGYKVQDLPWYSLSAQDGKIIWSHHSWLSSAELEQQVRAALAKSRSAERTAALAKSRSNAASNAKVPAAE